MAAAEHRKLFPELQMNQTGSYTDGNYDLKCQNVCYPYPLLDSFPPASSPPLGKNVLSISPYIIIAVALLASFLLLDYNFIIVRNYSGWRRAAARLDGDNGDFVEESRRGPVIDHPIWYIRTIGLPSSVIGKITVLSYKIGEDLIDGTDCSVCLNEFRDDETLQLLPKRSHAFHVACINTWLRSHTNCPLCRSAIVSDVPSAPPIGRGNDYFTPYFDTQLLAEGLILEIF